MREKGIVNWLIYQQTRKGWEPPYEYEKISHNKHEKIFIRVSQCLSLIDIPHKIVESVSFAAAKEKSAYALSTLKDDKIVVIISSVLENHLNPSDLKRIEYAKKNSI